MPTNELLTVQQFADAAGVSKQAVYKALNNKLMPYVQLVDGKKMLLHKALKEVYGVEVNQPVNPSLTNQDNSIIELLRETIAALREEIAMLRGQLDAKDRQIANLEERLKGSEQSLHQEQALHAGTIKQLPPPPAAEMMQEDGTTEQEKKKGLFARWKK